MERRDLLLAAGLITSCGALGGLRAIAAQPKSDRDREESELEAIIQKCIDAEIDPTDESPDPEAVALLNYFRNDLGRTIEIDGDVEALWLESEEVQSLEANCRSIKIGEGALPNESRLHKHGDFDYRYETRSVKAVAYIDFCHPSLNEIWGDVRSCAVGAAVAAVVAAVIAENYAAAKAVFYPVFYECLRQKIGSRAREVTVKMRMEKKKACWTNHC